VNGAEVLSAAGQVIKSDRQRIYGEAEKNFETIAEFWTTYLGTFLSAKDVACMMVLLKIARTISSPDHTDNYVDMCGYGALAAEMVSERKETND